MECTQHDHGHHTREEDHDDERVHDAEPLDVGVRHGLQDVIPTGCPLDVLVFLKMIMNIIVMVYLYYMLFILQKKQKGEKLPSFESHFSKPKIT